MFIGKCYSDIFSLFCRKSGFNCVRKRKPLKCGNGDRTLKIEEFIRSENNMKLSSF